MLKSEMYRLAQLAVMKDTTLTEEAKLEIILELEPGKTLARWSEEAEAKKEAANEEV